MPNTEQVLFDLQKRVAQLEQQVKNAAKLEARVTTLEQIVKVLYYKQNSAMKGLNSTLHNMGSDITNANRKIAKATKV